MKERKKTIEVPIKLVGKDSWADLGALSLAHEIVGERVDLKDGNFSFAGGHRVRLYKFKKNVHFKVPDGISLDIEDVKAEPNPSRRKR